MKPANQDELNGYVIRALEDLSTFVKTHMEQEENRFLRVEDNINSINKKLNVIIICFVGYVGITLGPKALSFIGIFV